MNKTFWKKMVLLFYVSWPSIMIYDSMQTAISLITFT